MNTPPHFQEYLKDRKFMPCPLCGNEDVAAYIEDDSERSLWLHIRCNACPIEYTTCLASGSRTPLDRVKLEHDIARWNLRGGLWETYIKS